jgi:HD-like signal output (HDOD) protein
MAATTPSAKYIASKVSELYSLPSIYNELENAIKSPYCELQDLADILLEDAGVSARVLKLANSAFYNFPSKVETITRAITIIGTRQLVDIVLATCVINLFDNIKQEIVDMESFWRHSIAVGVCAKTIATYKREANTERFYLMGLLHDIGRLVMFIQIPELMSQIIEQARAENRVLRDCETNQLGFDYTEVGAYFLEEWKLPPSIQQAVRTQHSLSDQNAGLDDAAIIHISDIISNALELGSSGEVCIPKLTPKAWETLQLKPSQIPSIIERIQSQYEDIVDIFVS